MAVLALPQAACNTPYPPPQFPDAETSFPGPIARAAEAPLTRALG